MDVHSELIVLNTTKVGEKSLVIHALTPIWGRRSFVTNVPKGGSMALFMPMNIIEAVISENPRSDLWRMKGAGTDYPLNGIRTSITKNSITMFMSEVLYRAIRDGANEDGLFEWCRKSILTLDALESDFSNYHLRFLFELAAALGFSPTMRDLQPFVGSQAARIEELLSLSMGEFLIHPLNGETKNEIAEVLLRYIAYHTECQLNVRSLRVLHELFR